MSVVERIRPGIRIESDSDGVRFTGLGSAITVRGAASARLWDSLYDHFVAGVETAQLIESLPDDRVRKIVSNLVASLRSERMLQEVECASASGACTGLSTEMRRYVEHRADRPIATTKLLDETVATISGEPAIVAATLALFTEHGFTARANSEALEEQVDVAFGPAADPARWHLALTMLGSGATALGPVPAATETCSLLQASPGTGPVPRPP